MFAEDTINMGASTHPLSTRARARPLHVLVVDDAGPPKAEADGYQP